MEELIIVSKKLIEQKQYANNNQRLDILINKLAPTNNSNPQKIAVAVQWVLALISIDSIIYLEAIGNYTQLHFTDGKKG